MKKLFSLILWLIIITSSACVSAADINACDYMHNKDLRSIKSIIKLQARYANRTNLNKYISFYDTSFKNSDGFDYETYSKMVRELWTTYKKIKYDVKISDINIDGQSAKVKLTETSSANVKATKNMNGVLNSESSSICYLKKINGKWKLVYEEVLNEKTSMLYGDAMALDVKLSAPISVVPKTEYTASLEFVPPENTFAIASIAKEKIVYPQNKAKEVYRKMPDDNILERLFIANSDNANEYIIASIGITKANVENLSIKLSLTGFGYEIIRVNVVPEYKEDINVKD